MRTPITTLVKQRKSSKFPVNQEVSKNADGSGGPIESVAKKINPAMIKKGIAMLKSTQGNNKNVTVTQNANTDDMSIGYSTSPAKKKDACYTKVKSRYKKWPSAYASGALVKCRKVGAANWGNKSK